MRHEDDATSQILARGSGRGSWAIEVCQRANEPGFLQLGNEVWPIPRLAGCRARQSSVHSGVQAGLEGTWSYGALHVRYEL